MARSRLARITFPVQPGWEEREYIQFYGEVPYFCAFFINKSLVTCTFQLPYLAGQSCARPNLERGVYYEKELGSSGQ